MLESLSPRTNQTKSVRLLLRCGFVLVSLSFTYLCEHESVDLRLHVTSLRRHLMRGLSKSRYCRKSAESDNDEHCHILSGDGE